ncbi:MAG: penicillin-binding protein 2 [Alphaproteobacteria bacterium]|nr:penicillin-binding protein 2 [Alphaproteobacteria bacterium]
MFEVGKDIFKFGFRGNAGDAVGRGRLRFMYCWVFVLAFCLFAGRTLQLGIQGTDRSRLRGADGAWEVSRADIVDRNGDILAKNVMSGHITLRPGAVVDRDAVANMIHQVLPYEYTLSQALDLVNSSRKFIYVKKYASDNQREAIKNARLQGLEIETIQTRKYPKRRLFSHVVGFVGNDGHGLEGAERTYDEYLSQNKDPLRLSVDSRIQAVFYEQLSFAMQKYQTKAAMGMLMNSRTGEIIAMVSLPDYDPENLRADPAANRLFKPMRSVFEMGSIFKIFNTALALENGIPVEKEYYVAKPYPIYDKFGRVAKNITDIRSFKPPRPSINVEEIMVHSCNVGSAQIALELPDGAQKEFFERLHMDKALKLEFGRTENTIPQRKWGPVERATVAYGQGYAVTPMHLMLAVNAVTNGGIYLYPTLQKRSVGVVRGERVLADEISAKLRPIMLRVAEETSGKKARVAGIQIGGKTATAEKYTNGKIDTKRNITAFVGIFPANAPQYTILVVLDEPQGTKESWGWRTAAWNAVPTTGKILDSILPLLFE